MGNLYHHKTDRRGEKETKKNVKIVFLLYKNLLSLTLSLPQSFLQMFGLYLKA